MQEQDKNFTDLDLTLIQLVNTDWSRFVQIVGEDAILNAKICILRSRGNSIRQISQRLNITKDKSEYNCEKCMLPKKNSVGNLPTESK